MFCGRARAAPARTISRLRDAGRSAEAGHDDDERSADRRQRCGFGIGLTYEPITGNPIDATFKIKKPIVCHVGPDAGWPVLRPFLEATKKTLSVAMYDFNADYIAKTFIETVRDKDLQVVLTWDDGMTAPETKIRNKLRKTLRANLDGWIVRCGGSRRFASAYHEKVAVRDSNVILAVQRKLESAQPAGHRPDRHPVLRRRECTARAIASGTSSSRTRKLAKVFEQLHQARPRRLGGGGGSRRRRRRAGCGSRHSAAARSFRAASTALFDADDVADTPTPIAPEILPTKPGEFEVLPVLTPDNYIGPHHGTDRAAPSDRSILQYAYITYSDKKIDKKFHRNAREARRTQQPARTST